MSVSKVVGAQLSAATDSLWKSCFQLEHEMILTVAGRRIFPTLEFQLFGLDDEKLYSASLHIESVDDKKLRYSNGQWIEAVSVEKKEAPRKVWHHNGVQNGRQWMQKAITFDQVRITNKKAKEEGNSSYIHLHTQHRYMPVLTIYEAGVPVAVVRIPHSQFITVTAYHKSELNTLKTNTNPYSTGSRKERRRMRQSASPSSFSTTSTSSSSSSESSITPPPPKKSKIEVELPSPTQPDFQMLQAFYFSQLASAFAFNPYTPYFPPQFVAPNVLEEPTDSDEIVDVV